MCQSENGSTFIPRVRCLLAAYYYLSRMYGTHTRAERIRIETKILVIVDEVLQVALGNYTCKCANIRWNRCFFKQESVDLLFYVYSLIYKNIAIENEYSQGRVGIHAHFTSCCFSSLFYSFLSGLFFSFLCVLCGTSVHLVSLLSVFFLFLCDL